MSEQVYTTHGYVDADLIYTVETVTRDDDDFRIVRTDKFMKRTGEFVGNDVNVQVKRTQIVVGAAPCSGCG